MRQRVDGEGGMEQRHGGDHKAPHQQLRAAGFQRGRSHCQPVAEQVQAQRQQHRHHDVEAVQKAQFGKAAQVGNHFPVGAEITRGQEPAGMAPPEAVLRRRMRIAAGVGMSMVVAMMRRPPQRPALHAGGPDGGEHELQHPRRLERAVREVAVVKTGEREHAQRVQRHRHAHRKPGRTDPEHRQAGQVQGDERHRT